MVTLVRKSLVLQEVTKATNNLAALHQEMKYVQPRLLFFEKTDHQKRMFFSQFWARKSRPIVTVVIRTPEGLYVTPLSNSDCWPPKDVTQLH